MYNNETIFMNKNWFKHAQRIMLLPPEDKSIFPITMRTVSKLGLDEILEKISINNGHNSVSDFLLCHFIPSFRKKIKSYYQNGNKKRLNDVYEKPVIREIDKYLSKQVEIAAKGLKSIPTNKVERGAGLEPA